jgi:integrase
MVSAAFSAASEKSPKKRPNASTRPPRKKRIAAIAPRAQALVLAEKIFADDFLQEKIEAGLAAMARNSILAMVNDVRHYRMWATKLTLAPFPLDERTIGRYLDGLERSGRRPSTAVRRLASLSRFVRLVGQRDQLAALQSDYVRDKVRGYQKRQGVKVRKAAPIRFGSAADPIGGEGLNVMGLVAACGEDLCGVRDAAVFMALYAAGLRVSEMIGLEVGDFRVDGEGQRLFFIKSSKTDKLGEGADIVLPPQAARLIERWISEAGIGHLKSSPLFRRVVTVKRTLPALPSVRFGARALVDEVRAHRQALAARARAAALPPELGPGSTRLTRHGVLHILRAVVGAAIDGGFIDIGGLDRAQVIAAVGTHSFRVGLTHDLFAANFDIGRVMLAQRWTSAATAVGYARDLAGRSSAVAELFGQFEARAGAKSLSQD